jgi:hypothetical protein
VGKEYGSDDLASRTFAIGIALVIGFIAASFVFVIWR